MKQIILLILLLLNISVYSEDLSTIKENVVEITEIEENFEDTILEDSVIDNVLNENDKLESKVIKEDIQILEITKDEVKTIKNNKVEETNFKNLYSKLNISDVISYEAFYNAINGGKKMFTQLSDVITIVDFSKPSNQKRMCIVDLKNQKVLLTTYVAHGRGSGSLYAESFSNKNGTKKSSLGFFLTERQYNGKNGNSLRLIGLEKGKNNNAYMRTIVVHGAKYAEKQFIDKYGRLGRSLGCFVVPRSLNDKVIDLIKGGTIYYVYK